jgi:Cdc6-like AAA superfamily ATPase
MSTRARQKTSSLIREQDTIRQTWRLNAIPFRDVPPEDPKLLDRYFVGRDEEMDKAKSVLYGGGNVLVRGGWGVGKTAFIRTTLHRLQKDGALLGTPIHPVHILEFPGEKADDFLRSLLYCLAQSMSHFSKRAAQVMGIQLGRGKKHTVSRKGKGKIGGSVITLVSGEVELEVARSVETSEAIVRPLHTLNELLEETRRKALRVVIAVDDIDKITNQSAVRQMLRDSLALLRSERCGFVLTGRPITVIHDTEIMTLGLAKEIIPLGRLDDQTMREIVIRQLNTVRRGDARQDAFPFSADALDLLVTKAAGYPRRLNRIADKVMRLAAARGLNAIGTEDFTRCFEQFQEDVSLEVPPDAKRILYFALRRNGILISKGADMEELFSTLGVSSFQDLLPELDQLVKNAFLVREDRPEGIRYVVAPEAEKAAEQGGVVAAPSGPGAESGPPV